MCSSRPKSQPPPTPPPPPERVDEQVKLAGDRERRRVRGQQGLQSTILTGATGVETPVTGQTKTLLGS